MTTALRGAWSAGVDLWAVDDGNGANSPIYRINAATGAATLVATADQVFEGLAIRQSAVPAPATLLLVAPALAAMAAFRRRRAALAHQAARSGGLQPARTTGCRASGTPSSLAGPSASAPRVGD